MTKKIMLDKIHFNKKRNFLATTNGTLVGFYSTDNGHSRVLIKSHVTGREFYFTHDGGPLEENVNYISFWRFFADDGTCPVKHLYVLDTMTSMDGYQNFDPS